MRKTILDECLRNRQLSDPSGRQATCQTLELVVSWCRHKTDEISCLTDFLSACVRVATCLLPSLDTFESFYISTFY